MERNQPLHTSSPLVRWYVDTRLLTSTTSSLPLIETLQPTNQETIRKFYHLKDKHMSLASNLLKYLFIHRTCRIPWKSITISHTPDPHRRPCFIPTPAQQNENPTMPKIEFNVSHQASLIALAGTVVPDSTTNVPPQVGIDITCVNERRNKSAAASTRADLDAYIDIFSDVFSTRETQAIKDLHGIPLSAVGGIGGGHAAVDYGYRLFYTYWALKEAYIKMTGEALLASWLKELEFRNVVAPPPVACDSGKNEFGEPYTGVRTELYQTPVNDVRIEVVALGSDFLLATAAKGDGVGPPSAVQEADSDHWLQFQEIDIERDVRPCAEGVCCCLLD